MDILNFISWIRGGRVVTSVDPDKTLIPVGLKDGRRDDDYLAGAISVTDLAAQIGGGSYTTIVGKASPSQTIIYENTTGQTFTITYEAMFYKFTGTITNTDITKLFVLNSIQGLVGESVSQPSVIKLAQNGANVDFELTNPYFNGNENFFAFEFRVYP